MKTKIKHFYLRGEAETDYSWLGNAIYHEPLAQENTSGFLEGRHIEEGIERISSVVGRLCDLLVKKSVCTREEMLEVFDIAYWEEEVDLT